MYKFLNLFLINSGKSIDIKKLLIKNKKKLGEINSKKLFFLLKNKLKSQSNILEFSNEKKKIVNLLNFQKQKLLNTNTKVYDFLNQKNKIKILGRSYQSKNRFKSKKFEEFNEKKKMSKLKINRRAPYKIDKKKKKLIKKILIKTKLFLNSIFFKSPRKYSITGGPRKRLSRNLRRSFKSTSVEKVVNLIWF
jgi:hypothetical protein